MTINERFAKMSDAELKTLAEKSHSLVEFAQQQAICTRAAKKLLDSRKINVVFTPLPKGKVNELSNKYSKEDFIKLLETKTMEDLAIEWNCHITTVYSLAKKYGVWRQRTFQEDILSKYTKEDLLNLYKKHNQILYKVAEELNCDKDCLSKTFKELNIEVIKHLVDFTPEVKAKISEAATKNALVSNPISHILNSPGWQKNSVKTRRENNSYKQPHSENRNIQSIPDPIFKELVEYRGVLDLAKELNCSQSAIRDRANALGIKLVGGPRKALTITPEWKEQNRQNGLTTQSRPAFTNYKNTSIEIAVQAELTKRGIKFELHPKIINLTVPDAFVAPNICIYVQGCYWHGCTTCGHQLAKPAIVNTIHDKFVNRELTKANYKIIYIWEHSIKLGDFSALDVLNVSKLV